MRQAAQRRFTPPEAGSPVDELSQPLAHLEERHPLLGDVHARPGLGVPPLARVAVTDPETAEAPELDLVALRQRVGDVVEDRVDDRLRLFLRQARDLRDLVDQVGFGHRRLRSFRRNPRLLAHGKLARERKECQAAQGVRPHRSRAPRGGPARASPIRRPLAWLPETMRPWGRRRTWGRWSCRPATTAAMNWPCTSSSSACSMRRSSGVIGRAKLPMSLYSPALTIT